MIRAVEETEPDRIFHLGDCWADSEELQALYPEIPMDRVEGNCDFSYDHQEVIAEIEGHRILLCHGHQYGVKQSLLTLELAAEEKGADMAMFGHTHHVFYDYQPGLALFNPGSIGSPPFGIPASYGVLTIEGRRFHLETVYLKEK